MKLLLHPAVEPERLGKIAEAAGPMAVINGDLSHMPDAEMMRPLHRARCAKNAWR